MYNNNFTVLVSGGSRHHWVSMCRVWPLHSKRLSKQSNKSASNIALSLNIPPQKLFRWFRRPQLWATGDWQLHQDNMPTPASHLMQSFWQNIKSPRWLSANYSVALVPCNFWLFEKLKLLLKWKRFQTIDEMQGNRMGQLMAIRRTVWSPKVPTLKGTEVSLAYINVFCVMYLLQ